MSDKTDPRLAVLTDVLRHAEIGEHLPYRWDAGYALGLLDAADRKAGIVRMDTNDEALAERIAEVLSGHLDDEPMWSCVVIAKRVLAALRETT